MPQKKPNKLLRVHAVHELGIHFVNACVWISSVHISEETLAQVEEAYAVYYNLHLFYLDRLPLCVWTLGYVAPMHARLAWERFGCGLGINSAQGREAKHQHVKVFVKHSTSLCRWEKVFLHDYMETIYIPIECKRSTHKPKSVMFNFKSRDSCARCGNSKLPCSFCSHTASDLLYKSAKQGRLCDSKKFAW